MFFPVWCWSFLLLLWACAFCLVTMCAPYLGVRHCGTRAWRHIPVNTRIPVVIATVLPEVKDLSLKAQVICTTFIYVKFYLSSIFWPWCFMQMKTARKKVSLKCKSEKKNKKKTTNEMQSDLVTSLPAQSGSRFPPPFSAKALCLFPFLSLWSSSHPSSLVINFPAILTISVPTYLPPRSCSGPFYDWLLGLVTLTESCIFSSYHVITWLLLLLLLLFSWVCKLLKDRDHDYF